MKNKAITFRIKRSARTKQFRCVVVAGNGEVILTGEPCKNRKDVRKMIETFLDLIEGYNWSIIDETKPAPKRSGSLNRNWP